MVSSISIKDSWIQRLLNSVHLTEISKKRQQINDDLVRSRTQKVVAYTDLVGGICKTKIRASIEEADMILNPDKYLLSKKTFSNG